MNTLSNFVFSSHLPLVTNRFSPEVPQAQIELSLMSPAPGSLS